MAIRLHELHPSLVHYPLALLPLAVGVDLLAHIGRRRSLARAGSTLTTMAAAGMGVSAAAGLIAQDAVKTEGRAHDLLVTHRSLNAGLFAATTALALFRRRSAPNLGSLAVGLAGVALMNYSAYLGGKMVYAHGVGVEPAGGVDEARSPELKRGHWTEAASLAQDNAVHALRHSVEHLREGEALPALRGSADGRAA